jgi:histidinol-phosphatase (PHP family)
MIANYHTHTMRCKHAVGTDEEYVLEAIKCGYKVLAFTDHSPWPLHPFESASIRMDIAELAEYVDSVQRLKAKYQDKIDIKLGLEAEYFEDRIEWLANMKELFNMDLLIFGNHFHRTISYGTYYAFYNNPDQVLNHYRNDSIAGLRTGLFSIFAHPDIFARSVRVWDKKAEDMSREIIRFAKEQEVYLEFNLGGMRSFAGYPHLPFWKIVSQEKAPTIIGIDAHSPSDLSDIRSINEAKRILNELNIELTEIIPE